MDSKVRIIKRQGEEDMKDQLFDDLQQLGLDMEEIMDRFMEDKELYISCLERFMEEDTFDQLRDRIDSQEYEGAFNCAHSLKGVSANLGLHDLYDAVCRLVEPLRANQYDNLAELYDEIVIEKAKIAQAIANNQE